MATTIILQKGVSLLKACDEQGEGVLASIPHGDLVKAQIIRSRNLAHHRKFYALCNLIARNTDKVDDVDDLVFRLKIATGHCRRHVKADGTVLYEPRSISFTSMDQTQFDAFYNRCLDIVCAHIIPGLNKVEIEREVLEFTR
jgi:hypothetical protein